MKRKIAVIVLFAVAMLALSGCQCRPQNLRPLRQNRRQSIGTFLEGSQLPGTQNLHPLRRDRRRAADPGFRGTWAAGAEENIQSQ